MIGKKYFILHDFWKLFFKKMKYSKIDQWQLGYDCFWPTSKAYYNSDVKYPNETFNAPKQQYS